MITVEQLMELGLTKEQAEKVIETQKTMLDGNYVPKTRFNEVNTAKKKLEADLLERDKQMEEIKKSSGDNEELKSQIVQLQEENKKAKEKYELEMKDLKLSTAIKLSLSGKVHDEELVTGLFKKEQLVLKEDGTVVGLEEQLSQLKESKSFLFKKDTGKVQEQRYNPKTGELNQQSLGKIIAESINQESKDNPHAKAWD